MIAVPTSPINALPPCPLQAQAVTLTVAQAFKIAFEFWQAAKEGEPYPLFTWKFRGWLWCFSSFQVPFPLASHISRFL